MSEDFPQAEDLAGQGELVAGLWHWINGRRECAQGYLDLCERNRTDNPYQRGRMSLLTELARFLKAAPAPSRPADRDALYEIYSQYIINRGDMEDADALKAIRHLCERAGLGGCDA